MDEIAYVLALITLMTVPATLLAWLLLHGMVSMWRRLGPTKSAPGVSIVTILAMAGMYLVREPLLRLRFGSSPPLAVVALILLGMSAYLNVRVYRVAPRSMALGLAELEPEAPGKLVTTGIYGRLRHPRFAGMSMAVTAMALITGYAALYALIAVYIAGILGVAVLEERELHARFGAEYVEYERRVPRFVPRPGRKRSETETMSG